MKTSRHLFVLLLGLLASPALWSALPPAIAVVQADHARVKAMMAGDAATLGALMSDQLRFAHSDGRVESKADYVKNLLAGDTAYADVKLREVETKQIAPDVVYVLGAQQMRKRLGPDWSDVFLRYLAVWRNEGGVWRLVAWQSARPAGNSVVPPKK
ncbi:MAG: nuclear transport factor 2 family protein [Opitutaceae bacterium]|nr:nuclear transport factor 2 family protein [Opitutaceae bacterium]